jgi:hypothetical protein
MDLDPLGRVLIVVGLVIVAFGVVLTLGDRIPLVGRLPGDLVFRGDGWTVYAPIATSIILSVLLTAVLSLVAWLGRR